MNWLLLLLLTASGLALATSSGLAQTPAGEFEAIFGTRPAPAAKQVWAPLIVDGQMVEELQIILGREPDGILIEAAPLWKVTGAWLNPDLLAKLRASTDARGFISIAALKQHGLEMVFDERKLELRLNIPAELRKTSTTTLYGRHLPRRAEDALPPSAFSAYLNLRAGVDYVESSASGKKEGLQPFRGDVEGAVNASGWVLEGSAAYTQNASAEWRRGDVRLVYDDPARMVRYSAGDLSYPIAGFQSFVPLAGLTLARNFSLQPYQVTEPRGQTSFFLKSRSKVEVFVNGQQVQTLQLPAGPQNLRDFQFASGGNDVILRITDDVGRVETVQLSFFFDTQLLAQGQQEFSYSIGLPARMTEHGKSYSARIPAVSLFHRIGLTDNLTAGLNLQGDERQQLFGGETVWATRFGTFQPDLAVSHVDGVGFDCAARLGYRYFNVASAAGNAWAFSAQYRGDSFAALGALSPHNATAWDFSGRYSQRLPWGINGGIGGSYQINRQQPDSSGINLFFSKRFGPNSFADLTLDRKRTMAGRTEFRAFVSFTFLFPSRRQSFRSSYDSFAETARADWQYTAPHAAGGLHGNVGLQRRSDDYGFLAAMRYQGYRAETSLSQDVTTPGSRSDNVDSRTSFRLGTALVYADGQLALSRPVRDSFVIVAPHPSLKGEDIGVDPIDNSYTARNGRFGPAVLPDLNSYLVRSVTVEAPDLPLGYDLGASDYTVRPTYKSGTVVRIGTGATVILEGVLLTADGSPVLLQEGEIVSVSEPDTPPAPLFTNRTGKFSLEGLKPGLYELRMFLDSLALLRFEIPKDKAGIYNIGTLQLPRSVPQASH